MSAVYVAWYQKRSTIATSNRKVITADTPEEIVEAFGKTVEPVVLETITVEEWLGRTPVTQAIEQRNQTLRGGQ